MTNLKIASFRFFFHFWESRGKSCLDKISKKSMTAPFLDDISQRIVVWWSLQCWYMIWYPPNGGDILCPSIVNYATPVVICWDNPLFVCWHNTHGYALVWRVLLISSPVLQYSPVLVPVTAAISLIIFQWQLLIKLFVPCISDYH